LWPATAFNGYVAGLTTEKVANLQQAAGAAAFVQPPFTSVLFI
jgi:hypothetical protein